MVASHPWPGVANYRLVFNDLKQDKKDNSINRLIFTRMKDIFSQNALANINKYKNKNCGKMERRSSQIKQTYAFEPYLNIGNNNHRKAITKLRLSSHRLEIEVGRWKKLTREERICRSCELRKVENETHFLFEWSRYMQKRILMYNFTKEKVGIDMRKEHEQFNNLRSLFTTGELSTSNALGKYIYECFRERQCT